MAAKYDDRQFYRVLIRVVFLGVTAGSFIALFAERFWVAELFTHFRLYYLLIQALLVLIFLHSGRRVLLVLTVLFAIPNAWVIGPYLSPMISETRASASIGIDLVALNANYRNANYSRVVTYLRECDADVVIVSEYTPAWRDELRLLGKTYPYQIARARTDPWGLAVFSRLPLVEAELIELARTDAVHARFVVATGSTELEIFAVHLFSPMSAARARDRNLQLEDLADRIARSERPHIVVGDMNLTPFSPYFSRFSDRSGLQDARRADGFHITWPASALPVWIPIDHALADPADTDVRVTAGPDVGSDHLPLQIVVSDVARNRPGRDKTRSESLSEGR